jgi:hypothetical protein
MSKEERMPSTSLYVTPVQMRTYLGIPEDDTSEDARLAGLIAGISRAIDAHCRRHFYLTTETRRYDAARLTELPIQSQTRLGFPWWGGASRRLWLDADLHTPIELINGDGTILDPDDYVLYPLDGPPYRWIDTRLDHGALLRWQGTPQAAFHVSGLWGYITPESEELIPLACQMWVSAQLSGAQNPGVSSKSIGAFSVSFQAPQTLPSSSGTVEISPPLDVALLLVGLKFREIVAMGS